MGKKHRFVRTETKRALKTLGVSTNEFGELEVKMTKAEARRRLLRRVLFQDQMEQQIIAHMAEEVAKEIDQEIFGRLARAANSLEEASV